MALEPWMPCRDIQRSLAFYSKILDFKVLAAPDPDPNAFASRHAVLEREGGKLHLDSHAREAGAFGTQVYVRVRNIDALFAEFRQNGLTLNEPNLAAGPIDQSWAMREFWCFDPDGNRLTFGQPLSSGPP